MQGPLGQVWSEVQSLEISQATGVNAEVNQGPALQFPAKKQFQASGMAFDGEIAAGKLLGGGVRKEELATVIDEKAGEAAKFAEAISRDTELSVEIRKQSGLAEGDTGRIEVLVQGLTRDTEVPSQVLQGSIGVGLPAKYHRLQELAGREAPSSLDKARLLRQISRLVLELHVQIDRQLHEKRHFSGLQAARELVSCSSLLPSSALSSHPKNP